MFDQMSRMEDHLMGMNRQLLAQNNALVKKMLLDDRKKQSKNDTKKKIAQGWMDMMVHWPSKTRELCLACKLCNIQIQLCYWNKKNAVKNEFKKVVLQVNVHWLTPEPDMKNSFQTGFLSDLHFFN